MSSSTIGFLNDNPRLLARSRENEVWMIYAVLFSIGHADDERAEGSSEK